MSELVSADSSEQFLEGSVYGLRRWISAMLNPGLSVGMRRHDTGYDERSAEDTDIHLVLERMRLWNV